VGHQAHSVWVDPLDRASQPRRAHRASPALGHGDPGRWASVDPHRAAKQIGFDLHLGGRVKPLITPDDPDAFETAVRAHVDVDVDPEVFAAGGQRSTII
jgi:hypothetical protein